MPIVDYSNGAKDVYRAAMIDRVRRKKERNPDYTVVDIGGRHNPWADEVVDAYVDIYEFETDKRLYVGDVNDEAIWRTLEQNGPFDFAICSHVLEDVPYPMTGLRWLPRIARAGFLGLPVKHREVANSKTLYWLGQPQHSWIYGVRATDSGEPELVVVPKWHSIHYFNLRMPDQVSLGEEDANLGTRTLEWFDESKSGYDLELGVIWERDIPFWTPGYTMLPADQIEIFRTAFAEGV